MRHNIVAAGAAVATTGETLRYGLAYRNRIKQFTLATLILVSAVSPQTVAAQNILPSREELRPSSRTLPDTNAERNGVVGRLEGGPCPFDSSQLTFTLETVDFAGLTAVNAEQLAPAWAREQGRSISVSEICRIRDRVADILLSSGYLARVEIPPQEIKGGRVRLQVTEAYIANVRVSGESGATKRKVEAYLSRLQGLAPFNMDVVQRQVLLASDIPGLSIATNIRPSQAGAGAVDLEVQITRNPLNLLASVQNYGSRENGPWSVLARADINSFTSLGERTTLIASMTPDQEQRVIQLLSEVRIGSDGLIARGSLAFADGRPGGALKPLEIRSESVVGLVEIAYPLVRSRRGNLWLGAGLEVADQRTDVFDGLNEFTRDKLAVLSGRIDGDIRTTLFGRLPALASGGFEIRRGLSILDASDRSDPLLSRATANPQATIFRLDGRTETLLMPKLSFATYALLQWADDPLVAYEEMSISNFTIGRGYDPGSVSGDRAFATSMELRLGAFPIGNSRVSSFAFVDSARIKNLDPGAGSGTRVLRSIGAGIRLGVSRYLDIDIAYARPLDAPFAGQDKAKDRLLVNLVSRFR